MRIPKHPPRIKLRIHPWGDFWNRGPRMRRGTATPAIMTTSIVKAVRISLRCTAEV
jgi:hypothetical protein